jgi:FKBP-type peptidyl-prolyl cis-trans isomerase (trigger factor)
VLPELDDDFAQGLGDFADLARCGAVGEDLEQEAEREAERGVRMQLVQRIIEANPFEVPGPWCSSYLERVMPAREGADEERLRADAAEMWPAAEQALKRMLVVERVAEMEALHATPAELEARIASSRAARPATCRGAGSSQEVRPPVRAGAGDHRGEGVRVPEVAVDIH